jgi:hypothetical protein
LLTIGSFAFEAFGNPRNDFDVAFKGKISSTQDKASNLLETSKSQT